MRGQVYNVLRGLVSDMFLGIAERESEEIAPKRERESLGTRKRERERESVPQCLSQSKSRHGFQYLTLLKSISN